MKSFEPGFIESQPITQNLLQTIRLIGEYKGKQELFKQQSPQVLETLRQTAIIQSTESSNRIEGITAPLERIQQLVAEKTAPRDRSEQEIAGYRDVLNTIHASYAHIPLTSNVVLQFHRDLYQFSAAEGGRWKMSDNEITETNPDGTTVVRFRPVAAGLTSEAMEQLHQRLSALLQSGAVEPLLLIATYVLDFLCIHPFRDGNGRMARLLALLLLYQSGYEVGRFISLEKIIERSKESYYETLYLSSQGWHEGQHQLLPWWEYFLGIVLSAYRELEQRVGMITTARGAKREMVMDAVRRSPHQFQIAELERACPGVSRPTINRVLADLRESGQIRCIKPGRDAIWEKT
ncbi:MAG: cell filamentation protein Fic [Leptolyngbya sp.]|nr:MAG: cell filamentation protein Fic [Leptolyngbya sp.]